MKTVSVFLASSIVEFKNERLLIGDYVRRLNDELFPKGIYVNLVVCEEISNALHYARKQSEYNDRIKECDFFYILIGRRAGGYTAEEYSTANTAFGLNGYPRIRCFFRGGDDSAEESAGRLRDQIINDGHPVMDFPDAASLIADLDEQIKEAIAGMDTEDSGQKDRADHISILLAMPEHELLDEQVELSDFVRCLNDEYYPRGIYFDLTTFGELQEKAEKAGDQDFFYIVFRTEGDDDIVRSFDVAKDRFMKSGNPRIYTFFQTLPSGTDPSESVKAFMNRLDKELGHFYSVFPNIDSLKLNMLIEVTRFRILSESVSVNDGSAYLNGKEFLELGNVPAFSRNGRLKAIREELPELLKLRTELQAGYDENDPDEEVRSRLSETSKKIEALTKELHDLENSILDMFSAVAERNSSGRPITWREKEASRYLDEGDYDAALALLRDSSREEELKHAISVKESGADAVMGYINEELLRIKTLKATGINKSTLPEIYECYERCLSITKEQRLDPGFLSEYLFFLKDQKDYTALVKNGEWLTQYHELLGFDKTAAAQCYSDLGVGYLHTGRYDEAIKAYESAMAIWKELMQEDPKKYAVDLARTNGNLAHVYAALNDVKTAMDLMYESLKLFNRTQKDNPEYEIDSAKACMSIANYYARMNQTHDAERFYRNASDKIEKLYMNDPEKYAGEMATCYRNMAFSYKSSSEFQKAEEICTKAISIFTELTRENPAAFDAKRADAYRLRGNIRSALGDYLYAEGDLALALYNYQRLAEESPDVYEIDVAHAYNNLGLNYYHAGKYDRAEEYYLKALEIYERLAKDKPKVYGPTVQITRNNLALVYFNMQRYEEAEDSFKNVIAIREKLFENDPRVYGLELATSCRNLADMYKKLERFEDAEVWLKKQLTVLEQMSSFSSGEHNERIASSYNSLADVYSRRKRYGEAEECLKKALELLMQSASDDSDKYNDRIASYFNSLGAMCMRQKKYDEAEAFFLQSMQMFAKLSLKYEDRYRNEVALASNNAALTYIIKKNYPAAEECFKSAIGLREILAEDDPEKYNGPLASSYEWLAKLYAMTDRPDEAEIYRDKARDLQTPKNKEN